MLKNPINLNAKAVVAAIAPNHSLVCLQWFSDVEDPSFASGGGGDVDGSGAGVDEVLTHDAEFELELFAVVVVFSADRRTPSIPWHRNTDPAVQIFGLISLALLRKKFFRPLLEILSE